ncbi:hypothetical protein [Nocardia wallacei]|uniref:hypothetical protein n=1 Tax=Nocardia wallacei TaxID=480035 RepID=UPI002458E554|nr:hypothetical protein [Nocardia wallacei]
MGTLVTKLDEKLQSMLIEQDDLAESWKGAGADAAARRVVNEKTAGSHISGKISTIKDALSVSPDRAAGREKLRHQQAQRVRRRGIRSRRLRHRDRAGEGAATRTSGR